MINRCYCNSLVYLLIKTEGGLNRFSHEVKSFYLMLNKDIFDSHKQLIENHF